MPRELSLVAVGDVHTHIERENHQKPFEAVKPYLDGFDVVLANSEGSIDYKAPDTTGARSAFRSDLKEAAAAYAYAGFDAVSLANNHQVDSNRRTHIPEVKRTTDALDDAGIHHAGAGQNIKEAKAPAYFDVGGTTFGFLSIDATTGRYVGRAGRNTPGIVRMEVSPYFGESHVAAGDMEMMRELVASTAAEADVTIPAFHWGRSPAAEICQYQREIGRSAVDAGADLVVGHHTHCPQAVEVYDGVPICYGLGGFLFDLYFPGFTDYSHAFECTIVDGEVLTVSLQPVKFTGSYDDGAYGWFTDTRVELVAETGPRHNEIVDSIETLCTREGTATKREDGKIEILLQ